MAEPLPGALADLLARLEEHGFSKRSDEASGGFGDRAIDLTGPESLAVRLVADRGQWFLELAPPGADERFDADVWRSCLDDAEIADEPSPLDAQARFVAGNLDRILAAAQARGDELTACLRRKRSIRARRRLGLGR